VCPTTGRDAADLVRQVRGIVEAAGLDHAGGFTMFGRHAVMLTLIAFDASDPEDRQRVKALFADLMDGLAASGHVPYRSHPAFMDRIADLYDFNDGVHRRTVQAIKKALDPHGVLAPGKQGVWPLPVSAE
jgi:4-cresol dehydrogenase (hydroxylating)